MKPTCASSDPLASNHPFNERRGVEGHAGGKASVLWANLGALQGQNHEPVSSSGRRSPFMLEIANIAAIKQRRADLSAARNWWFRRET